MYVRNGGTAFDTELNNACKELFSCVAVNPELINQAKVVERIGLIDKANSKGQETPADDAQVWELKAPNIPYSARCNAGRSDGDRVRCLPAGDED